MQNTHHPQFCTRDVDPRFCGGGAWFSQSDSNELNEKSPDSARENKTCNYFAGVLYS